MLFMFSRLKAQISIPTSQVQCQSCCQDLFSSLQERNSCSQNGCASTLSCFTLDAQDVFPCLSGRDMRFIGAGLDNTDNPQRCVDATLQPFEGFPTSLESVISQQDCESCCSAATSLFPQERTYSETACLVICGNTASQTNCFSRGNNQNRMGCVTSLDLQAQGEVFFISDTTGVLDNPKKFICNNGVLQEDILTLSPTQPPTQAPTNSPNQFPTQVPTQVPTQSPTKTPTKSPINIPTLAPSRSPSKLPSSNPTNSPTTFPTENPTFQGQTNAPTPRVTEALEEELSLEVIIISSFLCLLTLLICSFIVVYTRRQNNFNKQILEASNGRSHKTGMEIAAFSNKNKSDSASVLTKVTNFSLMEHNRSFGTDAQTMSKNYPEF